MFTKNNNDLSSNKGKKLSKTRRISPILIWNFRTIALKYKEQNQIVAILIIIQPTSIN
jgi:hypothetical protein